jgi:hypothetical protein
MDVLTAKVASSVPMAIQPLFALLRIRHVAGDVLVSTQG